MPERPFLFLDVPDRYIEQPIGQNVGVSVVVPMYKEFGNGNIFRLIDTFSSQTVASDSFEVLCVINNPKKDAEEESPAFLENQQVLKVAQYLKEGAEIPESYTPYQQRVIRNAQQYGLSMHMIDVTAGGVERNMGRARQVGVIEASKRAQQTEKKDESIIAHMDADTVVEKRYIEKLVEFFKTTGVESTALHYDYVMPHGDKRLFQTSQEYDRRNWYYRLSGLLAGIPTVSTPQIAATVGAHKKIGGVPIRPVGEDVTLFDLLRNKTNFSSAPHITVFAADRARVESFDGSGRYHSLDNIKEAVCSNPSIDLVRKAVALMKYQQPGELPRLDFVTEMLEKFDLSIDHEELVQLFTQEYPSAEAFFRKVDDFIRSGQGNLDFKPTITPIEYATKLITIFSNWSNPQEKTLLDDLLRREERTQKMRHSFRKDVVRTVLTEYYRTGDASTVSAINPDYGEFLAQNPWMVDELSALFNKGFSCEEAFDILTSSFPGFLGEWSEDLQGCTAKFKGLINFVMKCKHSREEFPDVHRAINYFSSPLVL